jgi:hypothetical protein
MEVKKWTCERIDAIGARRKCPSAAEEWTMGEWDCEENLVGSDGSFAHFFALLNLKDCCE